MPYLIIRSQKWDDTNELQYRETRKASSLELVSDAIYDFKVMCLGHVTKSMGVEKTLIEVVQAVYEYLPDGRLSYVDVYIDKLPPPRKVKVINNPKKAQANWLSILESKAPEPPEVDPYAQPEQEELDNDF